jgi:hypothetical protein
MKKKNIFDIINKVKEDKRKLKKIINPGFEKIRIETLRYELGSCPKTKLNKRKYYTIRELGFDKLHKLSSKGEKRWKEYFNDGGKVFIKSYSTNESMCDRVLFEKKIKKYIGEDIPLPKRYQPPKRGYVKGGVGGKIDGFNYYLNEEKLSKKDRNNLLKQSENYISQIVHEQSDKRGGMEHVDKELVFLDPSLTDLEHQEMWNDFFQKHGYRFPEFLESWNKKYLSTPQEELEEISEEDKKNGEKQLEEIKNKLITILGKKPIKLGF